MKKKPEPPEDLLEQMDKICPDLFVKDDPGFTQAEFARKYRLSSASGSHRLRQLLAAGKLILGHRRNPKDGRILKVYRPA